MLNIISSDVASNKPNPAVTAVARLKDEDNVQWIKRNLPATAPAETQVVLVGGRDLLSFRLRVAQSHVRHDLTPSSWSHIMLINNFNENNPALTRVIEISLEPSRGFGFPTPANGVQEGRLGDYANQKKFLNVAVLGVPAKRDEVMDALKRFKMQRAVLDSVDLILRWLAYCWGVGSSANPLLDGLGVPSAAMLDVIFGAAGYDLTPGLESRSSCPEAVWQAARWWYAYYIKQGKQTIKGAYNVTHHLLAGADEIPLRAPAKKRA